MSKFATFRQRALAALLATTVMSGVAGVAYAAFSDYMSKMSQAESGGNSHATNPYSSATGSYQFTQGALQSAGLLSVNGGPTPKGAGDWNNVTWKDNPYGVKSREDFMNNQAAQDAVMQAYTQKNWQALQANGAADYIGKTVNGVTIDESALLAGAHFLGPAGMKEYLEKGTINGDALANHPEAEAMLLKRMSQFAGTDVSDVTGQYTPGGGGQYSGDSLASGGSGGGGNVPGMYCDPKIAQAHENYAKQYVQMKTSMAENPVTGYASTASMKSPAPIQGISPSGGAAGSSGGFTGQGGGALGGLGGGAGGILGGLGGGGGSSTSGFTGLSCLDNLFKSGFDIFFSPPSLGDLMGMLENFACGKLTEQYNQMLSPINGALSQSTSQLGGFMPIQGIGGLSLGMNAQIRPGANGPINSNATQVMQQYRGGINNTMGQIGKVQNGAQNAANGLNSFFTGQR
jgi:hypothetical protein